jgi:hypothetical protein
MQQIKRQRAVASNLLSISSGAAGVIYHIQHATYDTQTDK